MAQSSQRVPFGVRQVGRQTSTAQCKQLSPGTQSSALSAAAAAVHSHLRVSCLVLMNDFRRRQRRNRTKEDYCRKDKPQQRQMYLFVCSCRQPRLSFNPFTCNLFSVLLSWTKYGQQHQIYNTTLLTSSFVSFNISSFLN